MIEIEAERLHSKNELSFDGTINNLQNPLTLFLAFCSLQTRIFHVQSPSDEIERGYKSRW